MCYSIVNGNNCFLDQFCSFSKTNKKCNYSRIVYDKILNALRIFWDQTCILQLNYLVFFYNTCLISSKFSKKSPDFFLFIFVYTKFVLSSSDGF